MGRSSAAQVSLVTKSGTNEFNGAGYWSHRNTNWSSNEYFLKRSQLAQGCRARLRSSTSTASAAPRRTDHEGPVLLLRKLRGAERGERDRRCCANVPSPTLRDGVLVYVCAVASQCPGGTVQGFTNSHSIAAGRYGLTPAELARSTRSRIGPSRAVVGSLQAVPDAERSRTRRHQLHGLPLRGAAGEQVQDLYDTPRLPPRRRGEPQDVLPRCQTGRRDRRHAVVPGPAPSTLSTNDNCGFAIGYDACCRATSSTRSATG